MPRIWTHDKRAGLIREEGRRQYVCRGFDTKDGNLIAAAPELLDACKDAFAWGFQRKYEADDMSLAAQVYRTLEDAIAKAEAK